MVNSCTFIGNVGKPPEMRFMPNGKPVCKFSIACNEKWKGQDGQPQERVQWIDIVAFDKLAENCGQYLSGGRQVYVSGKLQTRKYDDKNGQPRLAVEIIAQNVRFLGDKGKGEAKEPGIDGPEPLDDDQIPF